MSSESNVFVEADAVTDEEPHDQNLEPVEPPAEPKPAKTRKPPRKPMDEETKERLLKQLSKGRETAMMNRKKRAEAKKLKEKEAQTDQPPRPTDAGHEFLKKELSDVKSALKELLSQNDIRDARHQVKTPPKEAEPIEEMTTAMPTVTPPPPRIATSKGIRSRWDKYA